MRALMFAFLVAGFASLFVGCGNDDSAFDDTQAATDGKADGVDTASTYFSARQDTRRCVAPLCGGWWVKRVNRATTQCADGSYAAECYVGTIDVSGLGFSGVEETDAIQNATAELFRANIGSYEWGTTRVGALKVSEVWRNASSGTVASGTYYRVDPNQIRCIKAPCPEQFHEVKLNYGTSVTLSGFAGPFADKLDSSLQGPDSVLAAGDNKTVKGQKVLNATQFWTRYKHDPATDYSCSQDSDCVVSAYTHMISSDADCYCARCGYTAMNTDAEARFEANWQQYCSSKAIICPAIACRLSTASCVAGVCTRNDAL